MLSRYNRRYLAHTTSPRSVGTFFPAHNYSTEHAAAMELCEEENITATFPNGTSAAGVFGSEITEQRYCKLLGDPTFNHFCK